MKIQKRKRAQVTIFIIIAIVIVAIAVAIYFLYPKMKTFFGTELKNPTDFMDSCMEEKLETTLQNLSSQGGSVNPQHPALFEGNQIEYLCYTNEYQKPCVTQIPMIKEHVESELKNIVQEESNKCLDLLKETYEKRGYATKINKGEVEVEILPERIVTKLNTPFSYSKESTEEQESFEVAYNSKLYEMLSITGNIINWEAKYGNAETTTFMNYYPDLKVQKRKLSDGTNIYILENRDTKEKFQFASRSFAWPAGYNE